MNKLYKVCLSTPVLLTQLVLSAQVSHATMRNKTSSNVSSSKNNSRSGFKSLFTSCLGSRSSRVNRDSIYSPKGSRPLDDPEQNTAIYSTISGPNTPVYENIDADASGFTPIKSTSSETSTQPARANDPTASNHTYESLWDYRTSVIVHNEDNSSSSPLNKSIKSKSQDDVRGEWKEIDTIINSLFTTEELSDNQITSKSRVDLWVGQSITEGIRSKQQFDTEFRNTFGSKNVLNDLAGSKLTVSSKKIDLTYEEKPSTSTANLILTSRTLKAVPLVTLPEKSDRASILKRHSASTRSSNRNAISLYMDQGDEPPSPPPNFKPPTPPVRNAVSVKNLQGHSEQQTQAITPPVPKPRSVFNLARKNSKMNDDTTSSDNTKQQGDSTKKVAPIPPKKPARKLLQDRQDWKQQQDRQDWKQQQDQVLGELSRMLKDKD